MRPSPASRARVSLAPLPVSSAPRRSRRRAPLLKPIASLAAIGLLAWPALSAASDSPASFSSLPEKPFHTGTSAPSAYRANVTGTVLDAETREPLIGATVMIQGTTQGASTDGDGQFVLRSLEDGEYALVVRFLGYQEQTVEVVLRDGNFEYLTIELYPESLVGENVMVYAQALGQARAIRQQLNSNTIVNVVSESRLRELPDANAAESIGRLPGISVLRDAGEGQKVAIRGMAPRYSSITIDGNKIPGTDGDRSVDLSMISPEMLAGIEVYKSIRPDMDADAIGGSVNFKMGGARSDTWYRFNVESGYSSQITGVGNYKAAFTGSRRVFANRLGVMLSANAQQVDRSAHIFGAGYSILRDAREGEPHAPVEVNSLNLNNLQGTRQRLGGGLSLDWKLPKGRLFFNNTYNQQYREEVDNERRYNMSSNRQEWHPSQSERHISTLTSTLSGEHDLTWMQVEWRVNRSLTTNDRPYSHGATFYEPRALDRKGVDLSGGPYILPSIALNRTELAYLESLSNSERDESQENTSATLDLRVPVRLGGWLDGYLKFGGKHYSNYRDRLTTGYRVFNWETPNLFNDPEATFPWEVNESGRARMTPFLGAPDDTYWILNEQFQMAHMPSIRFVNQMWDEYSDLYRPLYATRLSDYNATERLSAGYVMTELNLGDRIMILPGIRYEYEHSEYTAKAGAFQDKLDNLEEDDLTESFTDSLAERNMGMWFPMVQARIKVTDWFDMRLARTVSTSRPSFGDLAPRFNINYDGGSVRRSNTQISPMKATNYDLFLTFYQNRLGLFTIGGFYKEVEDLIYTRNANIVFPDELGLPLNTRLFSITEPVNNPNLTTVHGFELEWQSNFTNFPPPLNGLVINANYSRFFSEANYHSFQFKRTSQGIVGVDTFRVAPMIHQADHIANVSVGYDYREFSARVSMQYQGATLRSIGSRPELDRYTDDYLRYDASIRQRFQSGRLILFANLNNITNREDRSSQFTYDRPRTIEYYGTSVDVGVELRF